MFQPRPLSSMATRFVNISKTLHSSPCCSLLDAFTRLSLTSKTTTRYASHATQGRANGPAPGPGKRLGATELVVPGNIIFRQRGTHWYAGENCVMGRDHTISALVKGYVRYYRDPEKHPSRKYIGVVFEQHETLPRGRNAARRRRLGRDAVVMKAAEVDEGHVFQEEGLLDEIEGAVVEDIAKGAASRTKPQLTLGDGYQYRESNTEIGRAAERAGIYVKPFKPRNRWLAWRLREARKVRSAEKRSLRRKKK